MARRVGRPRAADAGATRQGILRAAEESFALAGFSGATTRDMAARAGVNVATLHYHFGDKRSLYRAVREESSRGILPRLPEGGSASSRLAVFFGAIFDYTAARPSLPRLSLLDLLGDEEGSAVPDPRVGAVAQALAALSLGGELSRAAFLVAILDVSLLTPSRSGVVTDLAGVRTTAVSAAIGASGVRSISG